MNCLVEKAVPENAAGTISNVMQVEAKLRM